VDLSTYPIDPAAAQLLSEDIVRQRNVLPLRADDEQVWLAMVDPLDLDTVDAVRLQTGRSVVPLLVLPGDLLPVINRSFDVRERAEEMLREIESGQDEEVADERDLLDQAANAPIVRLVNTMIEGALSNYASDVHLEPQENGLRVRYRVDGVLYEQMMVPRASQAAIVSRVKVMAHMDIAERRRPQDGRISRAYQTAPSTFAFRPCRRCTGRRRFCACWTRERRRCRWSASAFRPVVAVKLEPH
jgi:type IV pilus assembly protein PilB